MAMLPFQSSSKTTGLCVASVITSDGRLGALLDISSAEIPSPKLGAQDPVTSQLDFRITRPPYTSNHLFPRYMLCRGGTGSGSSEVDFRTSPLVRSIPRNCHRSKPSLPLRVLPVLHEQGMIQEAPFSSASSTRCPSIHLRRGHPGPEPTGSTLQQVD